MEGNDKFKNDLDRLEIGSEGILGSESLEYITANTSFNQKMTDLLTLPDCVSEEDSKTEMVEIKECWHHYKLEDNITKVHSESPSSSTHVEGHHRRVGSKKTQVIAEKCSLWQSNYNYRDASDSSLDLPFDNGTISITPSPPMNCTEQCIGDISLTPSLSLHPWPGNQNFCLLFNSAKHNSNKWKYSNTLQKLFVVPGIAFPVELQVNEWINAYVNITPVFVQSENQMSPVLRCINHKVQDQERGYAHQDHIVQVEDPDAHYKCSNNRFSVDIPLRRPPPGENSKFILVKLGCWSSCVGGPNRKEFCLVFTLFNSHSEIGRKILYLKVCSCPKRDMANAEKSLINADDKSVGHRVTKKILKNERKDKKPSGSESKKKRIKVEPKGQDNMAVIHVPVIFEKEVKRYVNLLYAECCLAQNPNYEPPYPDD